MPGFSSTILSTESFNPRVFPSWPGWPPGFLPDGLRRDFVRRTISSLICSFDGGVLLLPEFLGGSSYFERRLRSSSFSLSFFLSIRFRSRISLRCPWLVRLIWQIVACCESMVFCIDSICADNPRSTSAMSLTCCLTDTKIQYLFDFTK